VLVGGRDIEGGFIPSRRALRSLPGELLKTAVLICATLNGESKLKEESGLSLIRQRRKLLLVIEEQLQSHSGTVVNSNQNKLITWRNSSADPGKKPDLNY
jgi:hypothetical protein